MAPPQDVPAGIDPQRLRELLAAVQDQVATALWLSAGMLCAFVMIACAALAWRRAALVSGLLYSITLCFVHNGHAQLLGPIGCALAVAGLLAPR
jgi:4-amino-4-deoxy-L-arabinose transferase-like glycosyltransferase